MTSGCCVAWCQGKQAKPQGHADLQQQPTAQRVALLIAKAAQYTDEYEQVVSTGLLEHGVVPDLHLAWKAAFDAAVSAVYLPVQLRVHDAMFDALSEATHMLPTSKQAALSHAATTTASSISMLAQSQALATPEQPSVTGAAGQQAQQPAQTSTAKQPVRTVKAAWPEFSKHHKRNSVSPLPFQKMGDRHPMADLSPDTAPGDVMSQMLDQQAHCRSQEEEVVCTLSNSVVRLHLDAVKAVVMAGIDNTQWHSSRKPLTWPDAPGHAVRLWRQMLQSLKEALLSNCPAVVAQDVLGRALLEGLQSVNLRYSQLQPSEQWQARLTADKWHITETCQLLSQPSGGVYRLAPDVVAAVSVACQRLCAQTALSEQQTKCITPEDLEGAAWPKGAAMESLSQHTNVWDMPEDVRAGQDMHMGGLAHATRPIKLVGGQVKRGCGVTMIGSFHDSHVPRSWPVCSGYA
ncbi:MAG: hypothetical protein FRX49_04488 [Trebouxia sp. A1-2]|nr:MAG: hypothetical protein FRX49_04488 [Trebouxia sp. A1-2]